MDIDGKWAVLIPLSPASDGSFLVDKDDAAWVRRFRWHVLPNGYVMRSRTVALPEVYLHRALLRLQTNDGIQVDHINRNRRDYRRSNLRIATSAQNAQNKPSLGGSSRYRGVAWDKNRGKWIAQVQLNGKHHHLGRFDSEDEAGKAASDWRREHMPFSNEDVR